METRLYFRRLVTQDPYYQKMREALLDIIKDVSFYMVEDMRSSGKFTQREMHELLNEWFNEIKRTGIFDAEERTGFVYKSEQVSFDMKRRHRLIKSLYTYLQDYKSWLEENRDYDMEDICDILRMESLLIDKLAANQVLNKTREKETT